MSLQDKTKIDFVFKKIKGRVLTTTDKSWYEEVAGLLINPHASEVWLDSIPTPAPQSSTSVVQVFQDLKLTRDITVNFNRAWLACYEYNNLDTQLKGFIPPRFHQSYTVRIFEDDGNGNKGSEIFTTHPANWVFDYENGILIFEKNPLDYGITLPIHAALYRYIGKTLEDLEQGSGDNTKIKITSPAGEYIYKGKVVYFKDEHVFIASNDNPDILKSVIGFSLTSGNTGDNIDVILEGEVSMSSLITNKSYFLSTNGDITINTPTTNILLKVGTAKDKYTLVFKPETPIRRL